MCPSKDTAKSPDSGCRPCVTVKTFNVTKSPEKPASGVATMVSWLPTCPFVKVTSHSNPNAHVFMTKPLLPA